MSKAAVLPATPAWTLGTRACKLFSGEAQPGPGEYGLASCHEVCSTAIHEPSFTIPGGRGIGNRERTPGPADYRPSSANVLPNKPAFTLAGRQGSAGLKQSTPGPGAYAVRSRSKLLGSHPNAPSYSMPASGRGSEQGHKAPGPGEYKTDTRQAGPSCSMKFRHEAGRVTGDTVVPPGPGQYSVTECNRPRSAAFSFGCSRPQSGSQILREQSTQLAAAAMSARTVRGGCFSRSGRVSSGWMEAGPGPGAYHGLDKAASVTLQSQPAYSFGSGRDKRLSESQPGPGAYSPTAGATTSRKAAFSIRGRPQTANTESFTPGPGQYKTGPTKPHVGTAPNPPNYTFGLKTLADKESERKPGPAAYNTELRPSAIAASLKFRHASNVLQDEAKSMPGPADYSIRDRQLCACKTVKGYTMGQRSPHCQ